VLYKKKFYFLKTFYRTKVLNHLAILSNACKDQVTVREEYCNDKFVRWKREKKLEYVNRIHEDPKGTLAMINDKLHGYSVKVLFNEALYSFQANLILRLFSAFF
jgi:hypothetical protein